jgi:hypothetical protein
MANPYLHADSDTPWLAACDGRMLAVVPCEVVKTPDLPGGSDVSQALRAEVLQQARRKLPKRTWIERRLNTDRDIAVTCTDKALVLSNGKTYPPICDTGTNFPNWHKFVPAGQPEAVLYLNPSYLLRLAQAIGVKNGDGIVRVELRGAVQKKTVKVYDDQAFIIEDANDKDLNLHDGSKPFGVLMPGRGVRDE